MPESSASSLELGEEPLQHYRDWVEPHPLLGRIRTYKSIPWLFTQWTYFFAKASHWENMMLQWIISFHIPTLYQLQAREEIFLWKKNWVEYLEKKDAWRGTKIMSIIALSPSGQKFRVYTNGKLATVPLPCQQSILSHHFPDGLNSTLFLPTHTKRLQLQGNTKPGRWGKEPEEESQCISPWEVLSSV